MLCASCRGEECNIDDRCADCCDWDDEIWQHISSYHVRLAIQRERKKGRKVKAASSSSFSGFSPSVPVPLGELSSSCVIMWVSLPLKWRDAALSLTPKFVPDKEHLDDLRNLKLLGSDLFPQVKVIQANERRKESANLCCKTGPC